MNELQTIGKKIINLPGRPLFMLDRDVAELYGTRTMRINEAVKRNPGRFPEDFCFQLSKEETKEVIAKCDNPDDIKFRPTLPYAFTREGCNMLSAVLNTKTAIARSIQIMRAFTAIERFAERRPDAAFVDAPDSPFLPSGLQMQQIREMYGIDGAKQILKDYCGINPGGPRSSITPMEERIIRKNNPNKRRRDETISELLDRGVPKSVIVGVSGLSFKTMWNIRRRVKCDD